MNKRTLFIVLAAALVVKFALACAVPLTPDEGLHWMQGRNLAWGFRDHPPVTAFLSFVSKSVLGVSTPSARLFAILSTTLCSLIAYGILRETGCSEKSACRGGIMLQLMPIFALGFIMVPVFPFAGIVFAAEYFFIRAVKRHRLVDHLLWGFFLGVSALSYYVVATAVLAAALFCIVDEKGRRCLSSPGFWAGVAFAAVIIAPNVWWNVAQGTRSAVYFQLMQRSPYSFGIDHFAAFVALSVIIAGPVILLASGCAARSLVDRSSFSAQSWSGLFSIAFVVPLLCFLPLALFREAGAHWAVVSLLNAPLVIALRHEIRPHSRWWFGAEAAFVSLVLTMSAIVATVGPARCIRSIDPSGKLVGSRKVYRYVRAKSVALDTYGWKKSLSDKGIDASFATDRWAAAGVLSFYTPGHPYYFVMRDPARHGQDYKLWNTKYDMARDLVFVRSGLRLSREVKKACSSVELLQSVDADGSKSYDIYLCKGFDPSR